MYDKTIIRFAFYDIVSVPEVLSASAFDSADNTYLDLDYADITKISSNNCL